MTVFPPAPLLWQNNLALDFTHSQIAYVGYEGTIFHLSGPFAPVLGAQSGVVIQKIAHLEPGFKHLDNKGARQDGVTWYDAIYDASEITMTIKLGGVSASDMRHVIASWFGAWDARQVGQLCWFSPERGEWVANVRWAKSLNDTFDRDWYESQEVTMTWVARVDSAFWQGPDSICQLTNPAGTMVDTFPYIGASTLDSNWNQTNTGAGTVTTWINNGAAWASSGTSTGTAICEWVGHNDATTDDQYISVTLNSNMTPASNAVQTVSIPGTTTSGTFTLTTTFGSGGTTSGIAWNASNTAVASALNALSAIGTNGVSVSGSFPTWTVTFSGGHVVGQAVPTMSGSGSGLTPSGSVTVTSTGTGGVPGYIDVWGRMNQTGTQGNYGVRARFGQTATQTTYQLSIFNNGTEHDVTSGTLATPAVAGDTLTLQCGVMNASLTEGLGAILSGSIVTGLEEIFALFSGQSNGSGTWNPRQFQIYHNGVPAIGGTQILFGRFTVYWGTGFGYLDTNSYNNYGSGYRSAGFGMSAGGTGLTQVAPSNISKFNAGLATGDITLTNIGDQPVWPRYLCYGPGYFLIEDVGTGNMIGFGPLQAGQVALLNTMPQLPPVVDLSPAQNSTVTSTGLLATLVQGAQNLLETLVNYATNNNVPPLLQKFESLFGIAPPQGPLASLLSGQFTQPILGMQEQVGATPTFIKCHIQGGSDQTQVVAALTPFRRWPE